MPLHLEIEQDPDGLRRDDYPSEGEQLGALIKFAKAVIPTLSPPVRAALDPDVLAVIQRVDDVKTKYPKKKEGASHGKKS